MSEQSDGLDEELKARTRNAIMLAAQVGEALARGRAESLRAAENGDRETAHELRQRLAAERAAAAATVKPATQPGWADSARVEEVTKVVELTTQWQGSDPQIDAARQQTWDWAKEQGVDLYALQRDIDNARQAVSQATAQKDAGATALAHDAAEGLTEALGDLEAAQDAAEVAYDSRERRAQLSQELRDAGASEPAVDAAVLADVSNAQPVSEAVAQASRGTASKGKAARRSKPRESDRSRGR